MSESPAPDNEPHIDTWRREVLAPFVARSGPRRERFETDSGIELPDLFAGEDRAPAADELPGVYPFTRGIYPTMYRGRLWTMRQYAGYASAEESNARYRYLISQGQTGLSVAFDLPTQIGFDADHPLALGEVGKVGVSIASLADMEALFDGIPLDQVTTSMTINATAPILLALYVAVGSEAGHRAESARRDDAERHPEGVHRERHLHFSAGPVHAIGDRHASLHHRARAALEHALDQSGYHMREAGATAVQEIAFTLTTPSLTCRRRRRGDWSRTAFRRACRSSSPPRTTCWKRWPSSAPPAGCGRASCAIGLAATTPRGWMLRFHTQTAGVSLTAQQPENNIVRVAVQALAAVMGGTQSLHTNSMDEALGSPPQGGHHSPCAPSRSSPMRAASPTWSTRWPALCG